MVSRVCSGVSSRAICCKGFNLLRRCHGSTCSLGLSGIFHRVDLWEHVLSICRNQGPHLSKVLSLLTNHASPLQSVVGSSANCKPEGKGSGKKFPRLSARVIVAGARPFKMHRTISAHQCGMTENRAVRLHFTFYVSTALWKACDTYGKKMKGQIHRNILADVYGLVFELHVKL